MIPSGLLLMVEQRRIKRAWWSTHPHILIRLTNFKIIPSRFQIQRKEIARYAQDQDSKWQEERLTILNHKSPKSHWPLAETEKAYGWTRIIIRWIDILDNLNHSLLQTSHWHHQKSPHFHFSNVNMRKLLLIASRNYTKRGYISIQLMWIKSPNRRRNLIRKNHKTTKTKSWYCKLTTFPLKLEPICHTSTAENKDSLSS